MNRNNIIIVFTISTILLLFSNTTLFAQWQQLDGPLGGNLRSILYDGETLYAAGSGGILASDDEGINWELRNTDLKSCDGKSLVHLGEYVFVSTDEGVFRTNNHGVSWEIAGSEMGGIYTKHLTVLNDTIFAATYLKGMYCSPDSGNTWEQINNGFPAKYAYHLDNDGSNIFCGTYLDGLYRSSDMGNSWVHLNNGLNDPSVIAVFCYEDKVFAATLGSGIFLSLDEGDSWTSISASISYAFTFTNLGEKIYTATLFNGVYMSSDDGETWQQINNGISGINIRSIGKNETHIFVGATNGKIYKRDNTGSNWELSSNLEFNSCVGSLSSSNDTNLHAGTHGTKIFSSSNGGTSWTQPSGIGTVEIRSLISSGQYVFAGTDMMGIYKSSDYGVTYSQCNNGLNSAWFGSFAICGGKLFAGSGEEGVFVSENVGSSWSSVNNGLGSLNVLSMADDNENVYAGTSDAGIFKSEDLGENWIEINNGLDSNFTITSIEFDDFNEYLYLGTKNNGPYISYDQGLNWLSISNNNGLAPQSYIRAIHVFDDENGNDNTKVLIGTDEGELFISHDHGNYWENISDEGLTGSPILSIHTLEDFIYVGMNGGGVWKYPISELSIIEGEENNNNNSLTEKSLHLYNYPNPFNPTTTIHFSLTNESLIELTIFNTKGEKVKTLLNNHNFSKGSHSYIWNGQNDVNELVGSGLYLYKLKVDGKIEVVKKCMMIK